MKSIVIYASHYGNTQEIAEAIGDALRASGPTQVCSIDAVPVPLPDQIDLVVMGGPTESHGLPEDLKRYLDRLEPGALHDKAVAVFDTRLNWPHWLSGSASAELAKRLDILGTWLIAPPESFLVSSGTGKVTKPMLRPGELERAVEWAKSLTRLMGVSELEETPALTH
jgi:flavodoxin